MSEADTPSFELSDCLMLLPDRTVGYGRIRVEGGRIAAIDAESVKPGRRVAAARLAMPGFVNAHGHTPMTLVRGLGGGLPLQRWLEEAIFPVEAKMTPADVRAGMTWGILEMLAGGTTCVADMYDFPAECEAALRAAGMRGRVARVGLSFVPGRLDDCLAFTRGGAAGGLVRRDLCIHSEYLTDEAFCRSLAEANRTLRRPVNFHVSETEREHAECLKRHGRTPVAYLAETGLLDFGGYAAHGVWCTDDDFRLMAAKGVALVHNPTSNLKLGSGVARVRRAMELGVTVALGTDGCASNDDLDMFEEMRLAALLPKGLGRDPTALSAWEAIEMATVNGAKALGMDDVGEIRVGARADLAVLDLTRPHLQPCLDAANLVVYAAKASDVATTLVDGAVVWDRGRYPRVDGEAARRDFLAAVGRIGL